MARRCRCDDDLLTGCQCSWANSDCIGVSGSGDELDPLTLAPIFDTDPDNLASCGGSGFLAELPESIRNPYRAKVHCNVPVTIAASTSVYIPFNQAIYDSTGSMWDNGNHIIVPVDGLYEVKFHVATAPNTSGTSLVRVDVKKNDTDSVAYTAELATGPWTNIPASPGCRYRDSEFVEFDAEDLVSLLVQNTATADLYAEPSGGLDNLLEICYRCPKAA